MNGYFLQIKLLDGLLEGHIDLQDKTLDESVAHLVSLGFPSDPVEEMRKFEQLNELERVSVIGLHACRK